MEENILPTADDQKQKKKTKGSGEIEKGWKMENRNGKMGAQFLFFI